MANAERVEIFDAPIENVFQVISNYESYPEFMDGVKSVKIISKKGESTTAEYNIDIIKKFTYVLELTEKKNEALTWTFVSGDIFKKNNGGWYLKDLGNGKTEVTYKVDVDFKMMVPGMISKKLIASNLPSMMKQVNLRAKNL